LPARAIAVALAGLIALGGSCDGNAEQGASAALAPRPTFDRFDAGRAWSELRTEVALGPRPAGSAASRRLAQRLRSALPHGRFESVPGGLRNIVGTLPGRRPAIAVAAHYDTKDLPGFVGANDGAGGTATVVELARALARGRTSRSRELRFVLFDGEESPRGSPDWAFLRDGLRGSRAYAARHPGEIGTLVLVDFVADRDLSLPREAGSDPALWGALRASARRVGVGAAFPARVRGVVYDDHTPFTSRGVRAIDLIDFDYACWHRRCDDERHVSPRSLNAAGEALVDLLKRL
jgi:hypothetical protein